MNAIPNSTTPIDSIDGEDDDNRLPSADTINAALRAGLYPSWWSALGIDSQFGLIGTVDEFCKRVSAIGDALWSADPDCNVNSRVLGQMLCELTKDATNFMNAWRALADAKQADAEKAAATADLPEVDIEALQRRFSRRMLALFPFEEASTLGWVLGAAVKRDWRDVERMIDKLERMKLTCWPHAETGEDLRREAAEIEQPA